MAKIIRRTLASVAFVAAAVLPMSPVAAQTQQQLSWCLHKDDAFSPALRIEGCSAAIKSGRHSGKDLSRIFYNRAIAYAKKNQYDRAIPDFDQAIRLDPDSIFALNNRGAAYARNGHYDNAIADFNEAIRIDASSAITYNNRGIAYAKKGQYDRAIEDFDQAIRFDPTDASSVKNRSLAKQLRGDKADAKTEVASVLKKNPLTEQMKESAPSVETIEASVPRNNVVAKQTNDNSAKTAPPSITSSNTVAPSASAPSTIAPNAIVPGVVAPTMIAPSVITPTAISPIVSANEGPALHVRGTTKPHTNTVTDVRPKVAPVPKSRRVASVPIKSKVRHATARPHHARPQPALARFFRKLPDLRKVFRLASRRSNSTQRTTY